MIAFTRFDLGALIVLVILLAFTGPDAGEAYPRPPAMDERPREPFRGPHGCSPHPLPLAVHP